MASALHALDARLKRLNLGDWLVRRYPIYYGPTRRQMERLETCTPAERIAWTASRIQVVLHAASRTQYGRRVNAPAELRDWPLLHKDTVRDDPKSFHTWRRATGALSSTLSSRTSRRCCMGTTVRREMGVAQLRPQVAGDDCRLAAANSGPTQFSHRSVYLAGEWCLPRRVGRDVRESQIRVMRSLLTSQLPSMRNRRV